jgi:hypothetical protein
MAFGWSPAGVNEDSILNSFSIKLINIYPSFKNIEDAFFLRSFHAAEQRSKGRQNDSAEQSDFPKRPHFASSAGQQQASSESASDWLPFLSPLRCWFVFFAPLKTEHKGTQRK